MYSKVYIPLVCLNELSKYGFKPNSYYKNGGFAIFETEKGDIGAILARYNVSKEKIGLCVEIVKSFGGYTEGLNHDKDVLVKDNGYIFKPNQLALPGIFEKTQYDETSHIRSDGKRKRKKK